MFGYSKYETTNPGLLAFDDNLRSRANRNQGDDETSILKGLPIRQWRLTEETIGPPPEIKPETNQVPVTMPRDWKMLPEISQQLLLRARQGHIFHNPTPVVNGKEDKSKTGAKEAEGGFRSKKWTLIARDQEAEEPTYLAKRRKGLPPVYGATIANLNPQASYRTTKVKKYDAEGKLHVYEVLAPEGQQVEGEIVAEDEAAKAAPVEPVAAAPGTVVEGVGVVNEHGVVVSNDLLLPTPPRRKPPPPRRKPKKGPGRGKKKVLFEGGEAATADGTAPGGLLNVPGIAAEKATDSAQASSAGDTPMPDAGDDDEGSGSEGEDGDDGEDGREDGELSPSPSPEKAIASGDSAPPEPATVTSTAPTSAPAPELLSEVKTEQADDGDAMIVDSHEQNAMPETTDLAVADAAALPGIEEPSITPSLPVQTSDLTTSASIEPPIVQASSPHVPPTSVPTSEATQIPGLPPLGSAEAETIDEKASIPTIETPSAIEPTTKPEAPLAEDPADDMDDYEPPAEIEAKKEEPSG